MVIVRRGIRSLWPLDGALVAGTEMRGEGKAVKSLPPRGDLIWKGLEAEAKSFRQDACNIGAGQMIKVKGINNDL